MTPGKIKKLLSTLHDKNEIALREQLNLDETFHLRDLPSMKKELFVEFVGIVGIENIHIISMREMNNLVGGTIFISDEGIENLGRHVKEEI